METYTIAGAGLDISRIAYGCMRLGAGDAGITVREKVNASLHAALECGINIFDHADIYACGASEKLFGDFLREHPGLRQEIIIQSKCGIIRKDDPYEGAPLRYDFSRDHIIRSVEGSLQRLGTEYLDILLLHRPDPLADIEEVAEAIHRLHTEGKVLFFGVSNHNAHQIELLQQFLHNKIVINQVELSLAHPHLIVEGTRFNKSPGDTVKVSGTLEYCRSRGIRIQAWSPMGKGVSGPDHIPGCTVPPLHEVVEGIAAFHGVSREAVWMAWLLRHPAGIQPVIGSTRPSRIRGCCEGAELVLSREEWYMLFQSSTGMPVP